MIRYLLRRLLLSVITLIAVIVIVSAMLYASGDPVAVMLQSGIASQQERETLRRELGLDRPFILQSVDFIVGVVQGDLGYSLRFRKSAADLIVERLPATFQLAIMAMLVALAVAIPVGIISAAKPYSLVDYIGRLLTLVGQSIPLFWLGIMAVLVFSVNLRWLPSAGRLEPTSIILPAITLGLFPMARIARILRASMLEALTRDYIRTARSKGLAERNVLIGHALRNSTIPVVTVTGLQFGVLLGGALVTETIFSWPGLGLLAIQAATNRDFPLLRAIVLVMALMFVLINLITDVLYAYLDPRIRYE
jgi:peptide/nickel transport system permease protein